MTDQQPTTPVRPHRALRITLLATGSALVAATLVVGGVQFAQAATAEDDSGVYAVEGRFRTLDVDSSAAAVTVRYADVDEAEIAFDSGDRPLRLEHRMRGTTLEVEVEDRGWWIFNAFSGSGPAHLDITLPSALAPIDATVGSSAGGIDLAGDFGAVRLDSSAGDVELSGSAASLDAESSAGDVTALDLEISGTVAVDTSAGNTTVSFASLPEQIRMESSAGGIRVALPDGRYDIRTEVSAGSVDNSLRNTPGADRIYSFETSAGSITLEPR
ncbi:MAG: DUF4097 family beta strand repeat-containing protein [Herbiconiux sp.]|nr:DUF4097 family beta strand repeat-containing protein [Herbiconiux sp.]